MPEKKKPLPGEVSTAVCWNGIQVQVPEAWEIGGMGRRHLVFEDNGEAAAEIKWERLKKPPRETAIRRRLTAASGRRGSVQTWTPPRQWQAALAAYRFTGFRWQGETMAGCGVAVWCADCGTLSLLQFFGRGRIQPGNRSAEAVLSSYRDHDSGLLTQWAVYGIRAEVPALFSLDRFRFQPGAFTIAFSAPRAKLTLFRWAAASALLKTGGLDGFAERMQELGIQGPPLTASENAECLEWRTGPGDGLASCLKKLLPGARPHRRVRIWHAPTVNKILAVRLDAADRKTSDQLAAIADRFTSA